MNVCCALKFLSSFKCSKRGEKRPKMMHSLYVRNRERSANWSIDPWKLPSEYPSFCWVDRNWLSFHQILHEILNMKKVYMKIVLKILKLEKRESWINISAEILNNIETDPNLLEWMITYYDLWFFTYNPETTLIDALEEPKVTTAGKSKNSQIPRHSKPCWSFFLYLWNCLCSFCLPRAACQSKLLHWGSNCPSWTGKKMKIRFVEELFRDPSPDNVTAYPALSVKVLLKKHGIPLLDHPLYSPEVIPCYIYFQRSNWR